MTDFIVSVEPTNNVVIVSETPTNVLVQPNKHVAVICTTQLPENAITGYNIADLAITSAKLADSAVITDKLADLAVDADKLANLAVEAEKIATGAVEEAKLADLSVSSAKIQDAAVGSAAIAAAAIGSAHIGNAVVQSAHIGDAQVISAHIASLVASKISASSLAAITANLGEIVAGVLTGVLIRTAATGKRIIIDSDGIKFVTEAAAGKYGSAKYGSGGKYGSGYVAYFYNKTTGMPLDIVSEQAIGDIHLYNRSSDPSGVARIGDLAVVNGKLKICTTAGTPGVWTVVGAQTA